MTEQYKQFSTRLRFMLYVTIALTVSCSCQQKQNNIYCNEKQAVEFTYPMSWLIDETEHSINVSKFNPEQLIDLNIIVRYDEPLVQNSSTLQQAVTELFESEFDSDRIININPVRTIVFAELPAAVLNFIYDVSEHRTIGYLRNIQIILVELDNERVIIYSAWRIGTESSDNQSFQEMQRILSSIQFGGRINECGMVE